jgi:hypothetical protein
MFAADGQDWILMGGCGFQSSFWAENVTLRTRGSTVYRLFRQKVPIAGARTSQYEHVFLQTWRWMKVDVFLMHLNFSKYYKYPLLRISSALLIIHMVTLQKYFSHPSLVIYFFATPPIKVKLGQQIGRGVWIANHLHQSL